MAGNQDGDAVVAVGTCHMLAPCLHALAAEFAGRAVVGRIDTEANPETVGRYGVQSIPTMLFFYRDTVVDHVIGAVPRASLRDRLNRLLHALRETEYEANRHQRLGAIADRPHRIETPEARVISGLR